jgi:hypothetical protein
MQKEVMPKVSVMPSMTRKIAFFNTVLLNLFLCFYLADVLKNKNIINDDLGYYGVHSMPSRHLSILVPCAFQTR